MEIINTKMVNFKVNYPEVEGLWETRKLINFKSTMQIQQEGKQQHCRIS